jgi:hypothetical protein
VATTAAIKVDSSASIRLDVTRYIIMIKQID